VPEPAAFDVVIVHYHAAEAVREAVQALVADARGSSIAVRIFVADNGSTAEERAVLTSLDVVRVDLGHNPGYAGALNAVFPETGAPNVIVMNEDVLVLPGCLAALRRALDGGAAVAGPKFYWDRECTLLLPCTEERTRPNEVAKVRGRRSLATLERARQRWRRHARKHWVSDTDVRTTSLSGALLAFRRDTWDTVGPFDAQYHLYYEENDWLLRVAAAGLHPMYVPGATAIHLHNPASGQSEERRRWEAESFLRFGNRHYGRRFMSRLLLAASADRVVPDWSPAREVIETTSPVWLELSPSPLGFPAATMRLEPGARWSAPPFVTGNLYVQLVDDDGRELARYVTTSGSAGS
jgi:N-acetylglucosaminyl-diphospho-decaprenol L-rhamnosyltransferase